MFRPAKFSPFTALLAGTFCRFFTVLCNGGGDPRRNTAGKEQSVYRHLKDEPASLDPVKRSGLTEARSCVILFEGLTGQGADSKPVPGVAFSRETRNNQVWDIPPRDVPAGQTAHR